MEQELLEGIRRGKKAALAALCQEHLRRCWFLCCQLTGSAVAGAPLFLEVWREALEKLQGEEAGTDPQKLLAQTAGELARKGVDPQREWKNLPLARLAPELQRVERLYRSLPPECRPVLWLQLCGGLTEEELSQAWGKTKGEAPMLLAQGEEELERRRQRWTLSQRAAYLLALTQLKDPSGAGFQEVEVPEKLLAALWRETGLPVKPKPQKPQKQKKPWNWKQKLAVGMAAGLGMLVVALGLSLLVLYLAQGGLNLG